MTCQLTRWERKTQRTKLNSYSLATYLCNRHASKSLPKIIAVKACSRRRSTLKLFHPVSPLYNLESQFFLAIIAAALHIGRAGEGKMQTANQSASVCDLCRRLD
jgi:hypothetical protein